MANARNKRSAGEQSRPPEDAARTGVRPGTPSSREQADEAATSHEREVPVAAGSEMSRETPETAASIGATPATAPAAAEPTRVRAAQQPPVAERIETMFGRWGERLGNTMASARRIARDRTRALTASTMSRGAEAGAHPRGESAHAADAAERWPDSPTMQRAEEVVDRMSGRMRPLASVIGQRVQRLVARAREEAEDIWAEAESMRARGAGRTDEASRAPED